jgi:predicted PurR-regulated permease PerM
MSDQSKKINTENSSGNTYRWPNSTKLVVGLSLVALIAGFLVSFGSIWGPLFIAIVFAYFVSPFSELVHKKIKLPWRLSVVLSYVIIIVVSLSLITWSGFTLVDEAENLINFLENAVQQIPEFLDQIQISSFQIGPWVFDLNQFEGGVDGITQQLLDAVQPLFAEAGSLVGAIASGAASTLGWTVFILITSFFILSESKAEGRIGVRIRIPGYEADFEQLGSALQNIWNAFLRGQFVVFVITVGIYSVLFSLFGLNFAIGLAILAGIARYVPCIGTAVAWIAFALVAYFQGDTLFNILPLIYTILILVIAWAVDMFIDQKIASKFAGTRIRLHPASLLIAVIIGASLMGLSGMILAAPILASLKLFGVYIFRKMFDLDPWTGLRVEEPVPPVQAAPISYSQVKRFSKQQRNFWNDRLKTLREKLQDTSTTPEEQAVENGELAAPQIPPDSGEDEVLETPTVQNRIRNSFIKWFKK